MKKLLTIFLFLLFGGVTIFVGWKLLPQAVNFSGLQVIANGSEADIYLNNEKIGKTPYEDEKRHPGEYVLRLVPVNRKMKSWSRKIVLTTGAMTTVERYFSEDGKRDGGLIVYLQSIDDKMAQVEVITDPDEATVYFNKENKGKTPVTIYDVPAANQEIIIKKTGYEDKIHKVDSVSSFKLSLLYDLILEKPVPVKKTLGLTATESAKITTTLTPTKKPAINSTPSAAISDKIIEIIETGTGWLRVRMTPSTEASEAAKVNVSDQFVIQSEENGWIKIEYEKGKFGWVSGEYVKKL
jgi:uncharacterized protein YgiM (DUF1202 family)